jgi:hypothetical protein
MSAPAVDQIESALTVSQIQTALQACFNGSVFTGPDTLFGSATLKSVFDQSLPDKTLVIDGSLSASDTAVTITGTGTGPFSGMQVMATFTPSGDDVSVVVTGTSGSQGGWAFGTAFPSLAGGPLAELSVASGATLVLQTLQQGEIPAGLSFSGSIGVTGTLGEIGKLIGSVASLAFSGTITFAAGVPSFTLTAPVAAPLSVGPLNDLSLAVELTATPAAMLLTSAVQIELGGTQVSVPASLDITQSPPFNLVVTPEAGNSATIAALTGFDMGADLSSLLPSTTLFDWTSGLRG